MERNIYNQSTDEVISLYESDKDKGLGQDEIEKIREKYGYNEIKERKGKTVIQMFLEQFKDFLIIVLLGAALVSGVVGEIEDSILIIAIVVLNAVFGVIQENKAEQSMQALKKLASPEAKVIRQGKKIIIPAKELVPGDVVVLDAGDYIPADGRIIEAASLKIEESAMTGESVPVEKHNEPITGEASLGDQKNMVFMSSVVVYGRGTFIATHTGMNTQIGKIAEMIQSTEKEQTPLQKRLTELGKVLSIVAIVLCVLMFVIGVMQGRETLPMFMTAVSLAVAAIPEGLPAIVTVVLALGVQRLVKKHAIVRKLPAVETLGAASVICSDKTGTLTQNKMTVKCIYSNEEYYDDFRSPKDHILTSENKRLLEIALLCNDSQVEKENGEIKEIGDPTETALVRLAEDFGFIKDRVNEKLPRVQEIPFDSDRKLMTTIHKNNDSFLVFTKGAPDIILQHCSKISIKDKIIYMTDDILKKIDEANDKLSNNAYRVLGYAYKDIEEISENVDQNEIENDLIFVGLTGMIDPPREEVKDSIQKCLEAGIKPVMITGDHKNTAMAIAKELNILKNVNEAISGVELDKISQEELTRDVKNYSIYARVSPEHKVRIVSAWKDNGHIVAMTGDGVNDAPALKKSSIGCAMGITGTDVSKEAADIILTDDNFATIVSAVEEGRGIYANIRKTVHFLLSCNIGEIFTLFLATLLGWIQPLFPVQILWVNLITDSLPAIAMGVDPIHGDIMKKSPRHPDASIFAEGLGVRIIYQGIVIGVVTLCAFWFSLHNYGEAIAQSVAFGVLALTQVSHSINVQAEEDSVFKGNLLKNKFLILADVFIVILQILVMTIPFLQNVFKVAPIQLEHWALIILFSISPIIIVEIIKLIMRAFKK